jgi:hypothetical protein
LKNFYVSYAGKLIPEAFRNLDLSRFTGHEQIIASGRSDRLEGDYVHMGIYRRIVFTRYVVF